MLQTEPSPYTISGRTLKLITVGRLTGLPHVTELRYVNTQGLLFVLAGSAGSDWVLNALAFGRAKINTGEVTYQVGARTATKVEKEQSLESFRKKYGSNTVSQWYRNAELCLRFEPIGPPQIRGSLKGESQTSTDFVQWRLKGRNYYQSVEEAFDSASEEYDYTISRNYINTWIRERSIQELMRLVTKDDVLLEIGCGTGAEAIRITSQVAGIVATDISQKMLEILKMKVAAKRLGRKIRVARVAASHVSDVQSLLPGGRVRVAYSFNGALNCEPEIDRVPEQLSQMIRKDGYFVCSIRNVISLSEAVSHSLVLQFDRMAPRKNQPAMVSVGGQDIPSYYYPPGKFTRVFEPYFEVRKIVGLPAFLPPAYLSDYFVQTGRARSFVEGLEYILGSHFPFNRLGDQTLFVFRRK